MARESGMAEPGPLESRMTGPARERAATWCVRHQVTRHQLCCQHPELSWALVLHLE